jgi:hypothetical protein
VLYGRNYTPTTMTNKEYSNNGTTLELHYLATRCNLKLSMFKGSPSSTRLLWPRLSQCKTMLKLVEHGASLCGHARIPSQLLFEASSNK